MISVIIPTYNYSAYLADAIDSVLQQTYKLLEVIVIDDGSTDKTDEIVARYKGKIRYYKQVNTGASAARNKGVEMAHGDYIAFLDADDVWNNNKLFEQYNCFSLPSLPDMIFSHVQHFYSPENDDIVNARLRCPTVDLPGYFATTLLMKKETFLTVGFFEPSIKTGEFIDWYFRAQKAGLTSELLMNTLASRRVHAGHLGKKINYNAYCHILKRALNRERIPC
jgi:glycosyltransferase involved in cell wall biosynthesis